MLADIHLRGGLLFFVKNNIFIANSDFNFMLQGRLIYFRRQALINLDGILKQTEVPSKNM